MQYVLPDNEINDANIKLSLPKCESICKLAFYFLVCSDQFILVRGDVQRSNMTAYSARSFKATRRVEQFPIFAT